MTLETVHGQSENVQAGLLLAELMRRIVDDGTIYLGYPVLATADERVEIDALLVSRSHGLFAFRFADGQPESESDWEKLSTEQDRIYNSLESHLSKHDSLRVGRRFAVEIGTITVFGTDAGDPPIDTSSTFATFDTIEGVVQAHGRLTNDVYHNLQAAIQRVTTIRPAKRRASVQNENSRGATMKSIERGIANLDFFQKTAAIETPDGPQRIRGLAGSGKTIVLALKASLLHAQQEDWNIAVTFYSQSLYQQFEDLIQRFTFAQTDDLPNVERLSVMHAWGTSTRQGMYRRMSEALGVPPLSFGTAAQRFGYDDAFKRVCEELLEHALNTGVEPIFDAVLIDEAQDLPAAFFQLVYLFTKEPKRIIWAYDELQKLDEAAMADLSEMFGTTPTGQPIINLTNREDEPRRDIVLPVCYRNTPWALATAHAIGFGIYRSSLVQHFNEPTLWGDIGYQVDQGNLAPGSYVELQRSAQTVPQHFALIEPADAVVLRGDFPDEATQDAWVAQQILEDIGPGELEEDDILVVLPSAYSSKRRYARLQQTFEDAGLHSHLAGSNTGRDVLFLPNSIAVAHIFRAKGNEAPMVYVLDAQYAGGVFDEISRRNTIFTAITRSKAWVRICGFGPSMQPIAEEVQKVAANQFKLKFTIPTEQELQEMRRVNADVQFEDNESRGLLTLEQLAEAFERREISADQLPPLLVRRLREHLSQLPIDDDDN